MQKVGSGADFAAQLLHDFLNALRIARELRRIHPGLLDQLSNTHSQDSERLARTVVQFPGDVAAFFILRAQQAPGELTELFRLPEHIGVPRFQFLGPGAHLPFKGFR